MSEHKRLTTEEPAGNEQNMHNMEIKEIISQLKSTDSSHRQEEYRLTDEAIEEAVSYLKKEIPQALKGYKRIPGIGHCPSCKTDLILEPGEKNVLL